MNYSRARIEIVYDVLLFVRNEISGAKPTHILYKANLSPRLLNRYLRVLVDDGLIKRVKIENKIKYKITKKGMNFIKILKKLDKMTRIVNLSYCHRFKRS
jgi:predicted transcriptional regulator